MRPLHVAATAVLLAFATPPTLASAQSATHPLIGTWTMDVPAGMRLGPSGPEAVRGSGTLVVRQEGDSLIGLLDVPPPAGFPAVPPRRFAAALRPGTVTLERRSTATIAGPDGGENAVPALTQLQLTVDGDRLSGTQDSAVEGLLQLGASPQPVSGTRQGGR